MYRKSFDGMNCSIARALEQVGEWWSLLIVRECTLGTTRFDDFQRRLGIARNVLTARLNTLIEHGVLEKVPMEDAERRQEYRLTPKGEALYPVLVALLQWGDQWCEHDAPIRLVEHQSGKPIEPIGPRGDRGKLLTFRDIRLEAGPGATAATVQSVGARNRAILGEE